MPWTGSGRFSFTESAILATAPRSSGIYALFNEGQWIYIGEGQDIEARLLQHRRDSHNQCVNRYSPAYFAFEAVEEWRRVSRQDQLILELRPLCNMRLG
jgi:excinuclease UvrABC nuclease subunit